MWILSLDIASRTGWWFGHADHHPRKHEGGSVRIRRTEEEHEMSAVNIAAFIHEQFLTGIRPAPDLIVAEAMMALTGQKSEDAARVAMCAHTGLWAACYKHAIPLRRIAASTARKHFIGRGRAVPGEDIKRAVRDRCAILGYCAKDEKDFNKTDAVAVWDWAKVYIARRIPDDLVFF